MKHRIAFLLLAVVMALSMLSVSSMNAEATVSADTPVISVEKIWAASGSTVELNIHIVNNPGVLGATLTISWDDGLTLLSDENGTAFAGATYQSPSRYVSRGTNFMWYGSDVEEIMDGTILTLTFQVSDTVEELTSLAVNISSSGIYDVDQNDVNAHLVSGSIQIVNYLPGDVSGNRVIDTLDLIMLARYISDGCITDPEGYNVTLDSLAANVNDDANINALDLILISRYISDGCVTDPNGYNITLLPVSPPCTHSAMLATPEQAATCTEDGNIAYWYCPDCQTYFSDAEAQNPITAEETVIPAAKHPNLTATAQKDPTYTEPGNIAYWYCDLCDLYFTDSACQNVISYEDTIIPIKPSYAITYYLYGNSEYLQEVGVDNTNPDFYDPELGLKLKNLNKDGFIFDGWFDGAGSNATQIKQIAVGESGEIDLYAHWTPIEYKITYVDAAVHNNPTTYTVEDNIILSDPEWSGLAFASWTDSTGKLDTYKDSNGYYHAQIKKGTTGSMILTANWESKANYAVPETGIRDLYIEYDPVTGVQYFIYRLGTIHNVVLDSLAVENKEYGEEISWTIDQTVSLEDSIAKTASEAVTNSVTKTTEWASTKEWTDSKSDTYAWHVDAKFSAEWKAKKIFKLNTEISGGVSGSYTDEHSHTTSDMTGGSDSGTTEETTESSSTVAYNKTVAESFQTTITIGADMPAGEYSYVYYTDVDVYAVVAYDPQSGNYKVDTCSIMGETLKAMRLYTPPESMNINIQTSNGLPCDVPLDELESFIANAYYVKYEANGGTGSMYNSAHIRDTAHTLSENAFTKEGYTWSGWKLPDGTLVIKDEEISNLAQQGELITVTAEWTNNLYTITYDSNKPTNATYAVESLPADTACHYDMDVKLGSAPTLGGWIFGGWYTDPTCTTKLGEANQTLTTPNLATSGTVKVYAKWTPITYTITYNANGGSGSMSSSTHTFDTAKALTSNAYGRDGYTFLGWSTNKDAVTPTYTNGQSVKNLSTGGNVTLYAIWVKTYSQLCFDSSSGKRDVKMEQGDYHTETVYPGLNRSALKANGYTTVKLTIQFDCKRTALFCYNEAKIQVYSYFDEEIYSYEYPDVFAKDWENKTITMYFSIDNLQTDGSFWVKWSAPSDGNGSVDGWWLGRTYYTLQITK